MPNQNFKDKDSMKHKKDKMCECGHIRKIHITDGGSINYLKCAGDLGKCKCKGFKSISEELDER